METPELKQFGDLDAEDFSRHPVWVGCHTADYGKPWYDDTDEETFRPREGALPAAHSEGMLLVRAAFDLADGSRYSGFVTPASTEGDLGTQQPQLFVGGRRFSFWGGKIGICSEEQQALYAALEKEPDEIFPVRFSANSGLATGIVTGQVEGFYQGSGSSIRVQHAPRQEGTLASTKVFQMVARGHYGYPQPEDGYKALLFADCCVHCGIHGAQTTPFRLKRSVQKVLPTFSQLNWVFDAFFVPPNIAEEIASAGIAGILFRPVLDYRTGGELSDRVQLVISTTIACAETSRLPTVTCRSDNEEDVRIRAMFASRPRNPDAENSLKLNPQLEAFRLRAEQERKRLAAIPRCGRVKYHVPTSLALNAAALKDAPDVFQTAEWFGSGPLAYRLTLASARFVALVHERGWKGLEFHSVLQSGWSERRSQ
jgi:hypothetical protein